MSHRTTNDEPYRLYHMQCKTGLLVLCFREDQPMQRAAARTDEERKRQIQHAEQRQHCKLDLDRHDVLAFRIHVFQRIVLWSLQALEGPAASVLFFGGFEDLVLRPINPAEGAEEEVHGERRADGAAHHGLEKDFVGSSSQ